MIKSMTGYGKGQTVGKQGTLVVEIRTLNHKYFDITCRLANNLSLFEDRIRDYTKKWIRRGRVNLSVSWENKENHDHYPALNLPLAKKYYKQMLQLKKELRLQDDLGITHLAALPDVVTFKQQKEAGKKVWPAVKKAVELALKRLTRMREAEGRRLMRDLSERIRRIRFYLGKIEEQLPRAIDRYRKNILQKVQALSGAKKLDRDRIAEEVALFARNSDVSEEITRIKSHLRAFYSALRNQKEAGKELDFIAQELFREANTIGAKAGDFRISRWIIKMKSQIEKLREQLQNVE